MSAEPDTTPLRERFLRQRLHEEPDVRKQSPSMDDNRKSVGWPAWIALVLNVAGMLVFGGMFIQRQNSLEAAKEKSDATMVQLATKVQTHEVQLAVTQSKLDAIQTSVSRIEAAVTKP